jgi:predicted exporter
MRRLLPNRIFVALICVFALIAVLEVLRWGLLQSFESFGFSVGSAIGLAFILAVLVVAYRVDVARARPGRPEEGRR